jgi:hypothetical protein
MQAQLQERLAALGLYKTGRKEELIARLLAAGPTMAAAVAAAPMAATPPRSRRRTDRLPPVAAVVAKRHEKDEIPAYPPLVSWPVLGAWVSGE